jgi:hypothetical protein
MTINDEEFAVFVEKLADLRLQGHVVRAERARGEVSRGLGSERQDLCRQAFVHVQRARARADPKRLP